jgi:hypothetical protein
MKKLISFEKKKHGSFFLFVFVVELRGFQDFISEKPVQRGKYKCGRVVTDFLVSILSIELQQALAYK